MDFSPKLLAARLCIGGLPTADPMGIFRPDGPQNSSGNHRCSQIRGSDEKTWDAARGRPAKPDQKPSGRVDRPVPLWAAPGGLGEADAQPLCKRPNHLKTNVLPCAVIAPAAPCRNRKNGQGPIQKAACSCWRACISAQWEHCTISSHFRQICNAYHGRTHGSAPTVGMEAVWKLSHMSCPLIAPLGGKSKAIFYDNTAESAYVLPWYLTVGADLCVRPVRTSCGFLPFWANS